MQSPARTWYRPISVWACTRAAPTLAPAENAQTLPTVTITAGPATTEGGPAGFTFALARKVTTDDIEVVSELEETERVGESVNSNLVLDTSEGSHTVKIRRGEDGAAFVVRTIAGGVHVLRLAGVPACQRWGGTLRESQRRRRAPTLLPVIEIPQSQSGANSPAVWDVLPTGSTVIKRRRALIQLDVR